MIEHGADIELQLRFGQLQLIWQWLNFLRDSYNKTELFEYLADKIIETCPNNVIVTKADQALFNKAIDLEGLSPCNHQEIGAGKRMVKSGKFFGQPSHPLLSYVSGWQSAAALVNVEDYANATATPWDAYNSAAANA